MLSGGLDFAGIFEHQREKIGIKGRHVSARPRPSVNFSYMRLKFFHFTKSNRHRERDRPMDETT